MYAISRGTREEVISFPHSVNINDLPLKARWITVQKLYGKKRHWFSEPIFLDTETSHIGEGCGWIHQWCARWCGFYVVGRSAEDLIQFIMNVNEWCNDKGSDWKVLTYIHNLSYDMEYMRRYFPDHEPEFFAVKAHRILTARYEQVEFRCSYLLTGKSLEKWAKDSGADHQKLIGSYDYDRVILPSDPLSEEDWAYQLNDCAAMYDSWHHDRKIDGYDVSTVPLTSTGFVREDCRQASKTDTHWGKHLHSIQPDVELYDALEQAFAGGYTHGNRFMKEQTITGPIGHRDFRSSYPARQILNKFPMDKFVPLNVDHPESGRQQFNSEAIMKLIPTHALLMNVVLHNVRIKPGITAPYLGLSKCQKYQGENFEVEVDNGRVLNLTGNCSIWITELDFIMLRRQYTFGCYYLEAYASEKAPLPSWLRKKVMEYFFNKTTLKHADPALYMLSKAKLNGIYGMTAQKVVREDLQYDDGEWITNPFKGEDRAAEFKKRIDDKNTFLFFAWGVWTTALARFALFDCIETIGYDRFLYADTDSIFYIMDDETERKMNEYNRKIRRNAHVKGGVVTFEGEDFALGEFTPESDMPIQKFRFIHAKCYALIDKKGNMGVTVAGVTKKYRSDRNKTNADELETIDNLTDGFIFRECGGTRIVYNNDNLHEITVRGEKLVVGASAIVLPTEYRVHDTDCPDGSEEESEALLLGELDGDSYGEFIL